MGTFQYTIEVGDPQGERFETVEALVDTGASYTTVSSALLRRLGVDPIERRRFRLADDSVVERDVGQTWIRIDGRSVITLVVFGEEGTGSLLGAYTLEGLRLGVDSLNERLITVPGLLMASRV